MKLRVALEVEFDPGDHSEQDCIGAIERHFAELDAVEVPVSEDADYSTVLIEKVSVENSELVEA
jgi:hypothetical protein